MTSTKAFVLYGLAFVLGLSLILYSSELTDLWMEKIQKPEASILLGELDSDISGGQIRRRGEKPARLKKGKNTLLHGDDIRIQRGHTLRISIEDYVLRLAGPAQWSFEKWNPSLIRSPIYISIVDGNFILDKVGTRGMVYITRDGRIYAPEMEPPKPKARTVKLPAQAISPDAESTDATEYDLNEEAPLVEMPTAEPTPTEKLPTAKAPGKMPAKISDEATLSNDEIIATLGEKTHLFRRCQINSVRDNKNAEGTLLVSMTIESNGKVSQVRLLQDQIQNPTLTECVQSVLTRTAFRAFEGLPITVTYPVEFR